jgi:hypothetical protein
MSQSNQVMPRARIAGLVAEDIDDEIIVYDEEKEKAHCLNQTAALVWKNCDGKRTVAEIAQGMQAELNAPVETNVVWYALKELDKYRLLQDSITLPNELVAVTRREFLKQIGVAAAVVAPIVLSITLPTPAQAASCLPSGAGCTDGGQCCSGICLGGTCA